MGIHVIKMPDIGEGIAEVELVEWYVQPGDTIKADQTVADLMTDKATVEVPSPISGRVVSLGGKAGEADSIITGCSPRNGPSTKRRGSEKNRTSTHKRVGQDGVG